MSRTLLATNVVALPGAAPRKVDNYRFADQRRAAGNARKESPFAERYRHHHAREADRLAADLSAITQTPALLIVSAILRTMDADAARKVMEQLAPGALSNRPAHQQALATAMASRLSTGGQFDLMRALDRLHGEVR